jgi:sulfoxide reductase heme-binding subunit YedZ
VSVQYTSIGWNPYKKRYDQFLAGGVVLYLALFIGLGAWWFPNATAETLIIRGLGTAALLLLHIILCVGPLCRLNPSFLPLLYNRRHMGVTMFLLALGHGAFSIFQFHALGAVNPLYSVLVSNTDFTSLKNFPFQQLGFLALIILFLMAATSHDFWLRNLTPPTWKKLHMLVYLAYGLLVAHVTLGALQFEPSAVLVFALGAGLATVLSLHLAAAFKERKIDRTNLQAAQDGFLDAWPVDGIEENCAAVVDVSGERVAIFKYDGKISAVSNVCRHQNGPLGEGKIIDGCVTCPWHGYQYVPDTGASPPPFAEKVSTFRTRIVDGRVWVDPKPNPPGTRVEPSLITSNKEVPA